MNQHYTRRSSLKIAIYTLIASSISTAEELESKSRIEEEILPDPSAEPERLRFNLSEAEATFKLNSKGIKKDAEHFARKMVQISLEYAAEGVGRKKTPAQIKTFLSLFGLDIRYPESEGGAFVPFCAAGLSFAACRAYCDTVPENTYDIDDPIPVFRVILSDINRHYFKPSPSVNSIKSDAEKRGIWIDSKTTPKVGWLVVFSWKKDGNANHIGLVEKFENNNLSTVEYNTSDGNPSNGGLVAKRTRDINYVLGYIKTW